MGLLAFNYKFITVQAINCIGNNVYTSDLYGDALIAFGTRDLVIFGSFIFFFFFLGSLLVSCFLDCTLHSLLYLHKNFIAEINPCILNV